MDKLTALRVFRRVAELEGFAAAARDLNLSNAAISKNIRELEAELGARLINRTTRRLHLTDAGALYLERVRAVLDDLSDADAAAADTATSPRGGLRIAAPMSVGLTSVAPAVASFLALYPDIKIELELDDRQVNLVEGGFDVAIRGASSLKDSSLIARKIGSFDRVLCAAPAYLKRRKPPRSPGDLKEHACLVYTLGAAPDRWTFKRRGETQSVTVSGRLRVNNSLALAAAAAAGLGVTLTPTFAVRREIETGALEPLLKGWTCEPVSLFAISPRHKQGALKVRLFVEHLAGALR